MNDSLEIELFNELPECFLHNEIYFFLNGCIKGIEEFDRCTLLINNDKVAVSPSYANYNKNEQKVIRNAFQFLVELPSLKNEDIINIALKFFINKDERLIKLTSIPVLKENLQLETSEAEAVAVCMPLYNPSIHLFKQQLQSILNQSYQNLTILIQDDGSSFENFKAIEENIKAYKNVHLYRNEKNIGFYKNVEVLLDKIGDSFKYIALSDQDDLWELNKIEKQINFLKQQQADLCYTDLKIVDEQYNILQTSFWQGRSNHLQKPLALNLQNVATGSTMLLKQNILKELLPFPPQINNIFHDHYICAQLQNYLQNKVVYLDEPLISYVQHNNNVTGFSKFKVEKFRHKLTGDIAFVKLFVQLVFQRNIKQFEPLILESKGYYNCRYQRIKLFLLHQKKLSNKAFFSNWNSIKIAVKTFFLSYTKYTTDLKLNKQDVKCYKNIGIQLALQLRYFLNKR